MGIDDVLALEAAVVPNDRVYWISKDEALATRLATALLDDPVQ